jgi:hypothetical protein
MGMASAEYCLPTFRCYWYVCTGEEAYVNRTFLPSTSTIVIVVRLVAGVKSLKWDVAIAVTQAWE